MERTGQNRREMIITAASLLIFLFLVPVIRNFFSKTVSSNFPLTILASQQLQGRDLADLQKLQRLVRQQTITQLPALLIGRADAYRQLYFINAGERQGLRLGQGVISPSGVLVGQIEKVWPNQSSVLLLSDNESRVSAQVLGEAGRTPFILAGERGLTLYLQLVSPEIELTKGEIVVTGGQDPLIPSGLPIGDINSIEPLDQNGLFQKVIVRSPIEARTLRVVGVLIPEVPFLP